MKNKFRKILIRSCILFTIFVFIIYVTAALLLTDTVTLTLIGAAELYATCLVLAVLQEILLWRKLSVPLRLLIHYLLVLGAAYLAFAVIAKVNMTSLASFVFFAALTLIYSVCALLVVLIGEKRAHKESKEYTPMFKK